MVEQVTEETTHKRKRDLSALPERPDVTTSASDFIGTEAPPEREESQTVDEHKDAVRGTADKLGTPYDPLLHSYPPNMTQKGAWKKRRQTRARTGSEASEGLSNADYRAAAQSYSQIYAQLLHVALGEGAEPRPDEMGPMIDGFEQWHIQNGEVKPLPAWAGMLLGIGGYTFGVASRPEPKKRVSSWWKSLKNYMGFGSAKKNASNDSGEQRDGKNEPREIIRKFTSGESDSL